MNPEELAFIKHRLARADEALAEAGLLLAHEHANTAMNRLYYACFYAVSALLLTEGFSSPKHSGIRALFDQHWIKTGRLPREAGKLFRRLFEERQRSDYTDLASYQHQDVATFIEQARLFIYSIRSLVDAASGQLE